MPSIDSKSKEIQDFMEWCVDQIMNTFDMERKEAITIIEEWLERNW